MLVLNQHEKPAMGMGEGEKAWWIGSFFYQGIQEHTKKLLAALPPCVDGTQQAADEEERERAVRAEAANLVQRHWREEMGKNMSATGVEQDGEQGKKGKRLGDMAGSDACSRLFYNPLGMEMVMDCRPALYVFGEVLEKSVAIEMLHPSGGPLMARFWLDVRNFINVSPQTPTICKTFFDYFLRYSTCRKVLD
jgi:hypothetical protein